MANFALLVTLVVLKPERENSNSNDCNNVNSFETFFFPEKKTTAFPLTINVAFVGLRAVSIHIIDCFCFAYKEGGKKSVAV